MKKTTILACLILFFLALTVPTLYFYQGWYRAELAPRPHSEEISSSALPAMNLTDVPKERTGILLLDRAHDNRFALSELSLFIRRVLSRGYRIEYLEGREREREAELGARLEERLRLVDAFAIISPKASFSAREGELIRSFVDKGGKLLLITDPTRQSQINSLASRFGMTFEGDYLYNLKENEGNFRNIFVSQFKKSDLTEGVARIALYSASSISPSAWGLAFTDENTFSNVLVATEPFSPIIVSQDDRVLAISDLTFMTEPYNVAYDNSHFLSNIVDWLTVSGRRFSFTDFPYFLRDNIRIELADAKFIDQGLRLKNLLEKRGKICHLGDFERKDSDRVFLGLLAHAAKVKGALEAGGISVVADNKTGSIKSDNKTGSIKIEGIGEVYKPDTSFLYLYRRDTEQSLILLADKETGLKELIDGLETGEFRQWLATEHLALRSPRTTPEPKK